MFLGANVSGSEYSLSAKVSGNESTRAISLLGAKVPGSELARVLLADRPWERKGCESTTIAYSAAADV